MWYEILPSFFIIVAGVGLPGWGLYHIHNLTIGNVSQHTLHLVLDNTLSFGITPTK